MRTPRSSSRSRRKFFDNRIERKSSTLSKPVKKIAVDPSVRYESSSSLASRSRKNRRWSVRPSVRPFATTRNRRKTMANRIGKDDAKSQDLRGIIRYVNCFYFYFLKMCSCIFNWDFFCKCTLHWNAQSHFKHEIFFECVLYTEADFFWMHFTLRHEIF